MKIDTLRAIVEAQSRGLRKLAAIAGGDPKTFYVGADFSRADLRGQDLRGFNLSGADFTGAIIDKNTRIDERYISLLCRTIQHKKPSRVRLMMDEHLVSLVAYETKTPPARFLSQLFANILDSDFPLANIYQAVQQSPKGTRNEAIRNRTLVTISMKPSHTSVMKDICRTARRSLADVCTSIIIWVFRRYGGYHLINQLYQPLLFKDLPRSTIRRLK